MKLAHATFLLVLFTGSVFSQTLPINPYFSGSGRQRSRSETEAIRGAYDHQRQQEARIADWSRNAPVSLKLSSARSALILRRRKFVDLLMTPTAREAADFERTLRRSNSGIFTLLGEGSCQQSIDKEEEILLAQTKCLDQTISGLARQFSFRSGGYAPMVYADLGVSQGWLFGYGFFTQTVLTDLGDVSLEEVGLERPDLKFISAFSPATTVDGTSAQRKELENGVSSEGRQFFHAVKAIENHTYVLRSIAYRGELVTVLNVGGRKIRIDRLKGQKREDVTIAFRIVDISSDGAIRVLWRRLAVKESPKLDMPETEVTPATTVIRN